MMWSAVSDITALPANAFVLFMATCFVAGLVRGFSGFALSAVAMVGGALILSPTELLPVFLILEISASLLMFKNGFQNANRRVAFGLVIGSFVGLPVGLALTLSVPADVSRLIALGVIVALAAMQLGRLKLGVLASRPGLYLSGVMAGIASGLAGVGGMVVALYVLAQNSPAAQMRASLVLYLAVSSCLSFMTHYVVGTMTDLAMLRGLVFAVPTLLGVMLGKLLFIPAWERYYKPFCLILLIVLACYGILRLIVL